MPKSEFDLKKDASPEELFAQSDLLFDSAVRFAFLRYHHRPSPDDEQRLKQIISLLLLEDDYRRLRT